MIVFLTAGDEDRQLNVGHDVGTSGFENDLSATYPGDAEAFSNKWHHVAVVFKKGQIKIYEDQYRVLVVPDAGAFRPQTVSIATIADTDDPMLLRNVRVATGGGMNMIDRLTKDGRIVTHGILFDSNKATLKPESMGTIADCQDDAGDARPEAGGRRPHGFRRRCDEKSDVVGCQGRRGKSDDRRSGDRSGAADRERIWRVQARRSERHA